MPSMTPVQGPFRQFHIDPDREIVDCDQLSDKWIEDKRGYVLIKIDDGKISCGFVIDDVLSLELRGTNPRLIIKEIAQRKLVNLQHMGYIGRELERAKWALEHQQEYVQR
jgi:hypothetical protein